MPERLGYELALVTFWFVDRKGQLKRPSYLPFSPHLFRRSYATLLYKSGMKLKAIQNLTRHANIETLCKHYVDDSELATPYLAQALA